MIDPTEQWCMQIDVTNVCPRKCSNCTHLTPHAALPYSMSIDCFAHCVDAVADFPAESVPSKASRLKLIGIIGGEPLLHPQFADLACILASKIPREHRGLWTGLHWERTQCADVIEEVFPLEYIHVNQHTTACRHTPVLVSVSDVVPDTDERARLIDDCWLQKRWASSMTPKGFFFCEVAAAMDIVFDGPGGLPIEPGCWRRPLEDFCDQIERWCYRCGVPLNLEGRLDAEGIDDITESNLRALKKSPRVRAGEYALYAGEGARVAEPWKYLQ